jgi:hypothetical protein
VSYKPNVGFNEDVVPEVEADLDAPPAFRHPDDMVREFEELAERGVQRVLVVFPASVNSPLEDPAEVELEQLATFGKEIIPHFE